MPTPTIYPLECNHDHQHDDDGNNQKKLFRCQSFFMMQLPIQVFIPWHNKNILLPFYELYSSSVSSLWNGLWFYFFLCVPCCIVAFCKKILHQQNETISFYLHHGNLVLDSGFRPARTVVEVEVERIMHHHHHALSSNPFYYG